MPKTVISIKATIRDHTIGLPAPENTVAFGIPNACSECHKDKPAAWAVSALETYLDCPFKFFAQHVLRLAEEPDDEEDAVAE